LTWNDIDTDRKKLILRDPKGILDQVLPLSDKAIILLKNLPKEYDTKWVFYGRAGRQRTTFQTEWAAIKKAASLPKDFRFHGLRHHFASSLVSAGTNLYTVQKLLCHKDAAMTQRYAHLADKTLRDAVNLSDNLLEPKAKTEVANLKDHKDGK
jgi:integrase